MRRFAVASCLYLLAAAFVAVVFQDAGAATLYERLTRVPMSVPGIVNLVPLLVPLALLYHWLGRTPLIDRLKVAALALVGLSMFHHAFLIIKTGIPDIVPFWADPALAWTDRVLQGGIDPWLLAHRLPGPVDPATTHLIYYQIWIIPAALFPLLLALFDDDGPRIGRYLLLFFFCWLGLGNLAAMAGASVGPVFYDRLLGGARFAEMMAQLDASGVTRSQLGAIQNDLWTGYVTNMRGFGYGISAFPSVHVAIAALAAFYCFDRARWLAVPAALWCAAVQFLSVYTGLHYALDGYVSILGVALAWWATRRFGSGVATQHQAPHRAGTTGHRPVRDWLRARAAF